MPLGSIGAGRNDPSYQIGRRIEFCLILTKYTRILRVFLFGYAMSRFSKMPEPPYYAVIFANQASKTPEGYAEMAAAMGEIAKTLPGYIGIESTRDADGFAITVSYWESEEAIKGWRNTPNMPSHKR